MSGKGKMPGKTGCFPTLSCGELIYVKRKEGMYIKGRKWGQFPRLFPASALTSTAIISCQLRSPYLRCTWRLRSAGRSKDRGIKRLYIPYGGMARIILIMKGLPSAQYHNFTHTKNIPFTYLLQIKDFYSMAMHRKTAGVTEHWQALDATGLIWPGIRRVGTG